MKTFNYKTKTHIQCVSVLSHCRHDPKCCRKRGNKNNKEKDEWKLEPDIDIGVGVTLHIKIKIYINNNTIQIKM